MSFPALVATACEVPPPKEVSRGVTIRDSAGIEIVDNLAPRWKDGFWIVDPEPEFTLGGELGEASDASTLVWDIAGAAVLSDGRLALLSPEGDRKVLIFERSGVLSAAFGRQGRGPGEFGSPQHLQVLPGDTIAVWDYMFGPVGYFDPSGTLLKHRFIDLGRVVAALRNGTRRAGETVHRPLPDGSFLVRVHRPGWEPPAEVGTYRQPVGYARIDAAYGSFSFGWWEGHEFLGTRPPIVPFPVDSKVVGGGDPLAVYITNGDRYEVHQFPAAGRTPNRIIRRTTDPVPIAQEAGRALAALNSDRDRDWRAWERALAAVPQRFHPAIGEMRLDSQGLLWIQGWSAQPGRPGFAVPRWSVFHEGRWLGDVAVPATVVRWIGDDLIVGSDFDRDTGLETISGYRLNRFAIPRASGS